MNEKFGYIQAMAYQKDPKWIEIAKAMAEQPGCEDFPVDTVQTIVENPGGLLVYPFDAQEGVFTIGAMVIARRNSFVPVIDTSGTWALRINSASTSMGPGNDIVAEREISFFTRDNGLTNWVGAGLAPTEKTILAADTHPTNLFIGAERITQYFNDAAENTKLGPHRHNRLVGSLFQVALLGDQFGAPKLTAPSILQPEIEEARAYYLTARERAKAMYVAMQALTRLYGEIATLETIPHPAIHYEKPLTTPTAEQVDEIKKRLFGRNWPSTQELPANLESTDRAFRILDTLASPR
ncbi:hypothetical protein EOL96_01315 [Candidatus Saccharibacteria bacterium]|nr:hypothetical protein [Candidatus Saccharibacteria bacterium]